MKARLYPALFLFAVACCLAVGVSAQNLTVRDIMAEPSIAGMRVDGEKLSPDGTKVVYLWNAEGKMPRDLYLVPTTGGTATVVLKASDLPVPSRTPERENKLNYGVDVRDEFTRARENQLGNFEWSPDSKKLVFTHGGDLYVLNLEQNSSSADLELQKREWKTYEASLVRRADLVPNLIHGAKNAGIKELEFYRDLETSRLRLRNSVEALAANDEPQKSEKLRQEILAANLQLEAGMRRLAALQEIYPILRSNDTFQNLLNELAGIENRIAVARSDYDRVSPKLRFKRYTRTQGPELGARFLDNDRILFSQGGNAFVLNTVDATLAQLTREANQQSFISVGNIVPNKQGTLISYTVTDASKQRQLVVPNFVPEYVSGGGPRRGWSEQKLYVTVTDGSRDRPFEINLPKPEGVANFRRMVWTADGKALIVDRVDKDTKRRQLFFVNAPGSKGEQIILVTEETDDKWQASLSSIFEPNPKNPGQLFFGSERDGFNHLYIATLEPQSETRLEGSVSDEKARDAEGNLGFTSKVSTVQLTKGTWQVEWAKWILGGDQILYMSTEKGPTERSFHAVDRNGHNYLVGGPMKGMLASPQLDEKGAHHTLLYGRSQWNQPEEIYSTQVCPGCPVSSESTQLTNTTPVTFTSHKWTKPKFIEIASKDGKTIPAKIYLPAGHNPTTKTKYPMVIFVHGAGYLQNVINGWNNYYREFMFNDLLTRKGYVVLDIDYRGSAGYGRDWRTDVYDFLGGKDFDDHIDAIDYMVKHYGVDQKRIGAYGGSYGGFMAAMLVSRAPERIAAAAALRPVMDWKNYYAANPGYTAQRLGFPDKNPEAYKRSSPITYADKLERPLLILHGMVDDNVHVQDSVQYIEKLIRLGKTRYFEAMLYPSENHAFVRPESWADEYERILALFEKHLK